MPLFRLDKTLCLAAFFLVQGSILLPAARAAPLVPLPVSGQTSTEADWLTAQTKSEVRYALPAGVDTFTLHGKTGKTVIWINNARGSLGLFFLNPQNQPLLSAGGKAAPPFVIQARDEKWGGSVFPDATLLMKWPMAFHVRPNLGLLNAAAQKKALATWAQLPAASAHDFTLTFHWAGEEMQTWLDGDLMDTSAAPINPGGLNLVLAPGASLGPVEAFKSLNAPIVTAPVNAYPREREMAGAHLNFLPDVHLPAGLPTASGPAPGIALAGLGRIAGLGSDDLQSFYWRRSAADNLPDQRIFSVPIAAYSYAYVLCASDDVPGRVNSFTLRLTRYANSRGNAMADTIVTVPAGGSPDTSEARRVASVDYGPPDARKSAPLWLIKVPLKTGLIQDLLYDDQRTGSGMGSYKYLDVELLGGPLANVDATDAFPPPLGVLNRSYASLPLTSNVHVFGLTLLRSPASLQVVSGTGIQAFTAAEKPTFVAKVVADRAGTYQVAWDFADVNGKITLTGSSKTTLAAGEKSSVIIPVSGANGWYAARVQLLDSGEKPLIDYRTSFVLLPPDTRKAGLESPFYGWFFGNHGSSISLEQIGPLFQRLGIRRVGLSDDMPESLTKKYGFTNSTMDWYSKPYGGLYSGKMDMTGAMNASEAEIRRNLALWPHLDRMLIFHESGSTTGQFPLELIGQTPPLLAPTVQKRMQFRVDYLSALAQMVHSKFPGIKMQYGNDGNSMDLVGELFRQKMPRKYIDAISSEDLGQTIIPERNQLGGTQDGWYLRELARKMGYGDVPVTACTEWIGRMTEKLGLETQARWKVRDGLLALGYGYDTISIAGMNDAGDGYYYSIWGNGGLTGRSPVMAPKPAYAAIATLTQVLDQAKFVRFVPTDSPVTYIEEFSRGTGWVYALWTPRGNRQLTLNFPDGQARTFTNLYGRTGEAAAMAVGVKVGTAPQYLASPNRLASVVLGATSFPDDTAKVPAQPLQTIALEELGELAIGSNDWRAKRTVNSPLGKQIEGKFTIKIVQDPEMGACTEVTLLPQEPLRLGEEEYVTLRLKAPITTTAHQAAVWVKGNGNWGNVDITGSAIPWVDNHDLAMNWSGAQSLNFEGWNCITYPYAGKSSDKTNAVDGLLITFPRSTLVGTELLPVKNLSIRLKSIVLY